MFAGADATESQQLTAGSPSCGYGVIPGSSNGTARTPTVLSAETVRRLPDLTDRLIQAGVYAEYDAYRQRYLAWRKGEAQGASGELTASALQAATDPSHFEFWYPTPSIFKWRYTVAYWQSIFFLVGSLLFTFNAFVQYYHPPGGGVLTRTVPNAVGSVLFAVGCYFGYLQLINISKDDEDHVVFFWPDWSELVSRALLSSVIGTVSYFLGALLFVVGAFAELFPELPWALLLTFIDFANLLGSIGFAVGGLCELLHNNIFTGRATWREPVWWASWANFIGGINFFLGALPGVAAPAVTGWGALSFVYLNFMVGSALYILSSALMIVMWRANDFGLMLLRQLNFALQSGSFVGVARGGTGGHVGFRVRHSSDEAPSQSPSMHKEEAGSASLRGAFFIMLYCWFAFVSIVNCLCRQQQFAHTEERFLWELLLDLGMQVFVVVVIALVLVIHSVITEVPDEQPYWCALVTSRVVLTAGAIMQTVWFAKYMWHPNYRTSAPNALE